MINRLLRLAEWVILPIAAFLPITVVIGIVMFLALCSRTLTP